MKIRALNDADPEILTSGLQYLYFAYFLIFQKIYILKIHLLDFSNWSDFKNSPDLNVLERVLIAVEFLSKNIEKQKSYPIFSK